MGILARIADWVDERTGWRTSARAWVDSPVVGGAPWAAAMAAAIATCFGVLALTGVLLLTAYGASTQAAWASVHYVQFVQDRGWIVRGLHFWAAQALIVLAAAHVVHGAFIAGYRKPREVAWWMSLVVLALALGGGISGGLLPWDQKGWWARVVEGNIVGLAPGAGPWLQQMMEGGSELGSLGLARVFTAHVVLVPALLLGALLVRRAILTKHGWVEGGAGGAGLTRGARLARSVIVAAVATGVLFALTGKTHGAPLEAPADPLSDYPARPEWFLLTLYELRKLLGGLGGDFLGTNIPVMLAAGYLVLLPWLDRPGRSRVATVYVPVFLVFAGAAALSLAALRHDAGDATYLKQRARADLRAAGAARAAMGGVPPEGPLAMMRSDPELRGRELFEQSCAGCHVLGDLGDPKKATATKLDGWGTAKWIDAMIHDPDAPEMFGRGPFKGEMPSVDVQPKDLKPDQKWSPMIKSEADRAAVAAFLASLGDEPGDPPHAPLDEAARTKAESTVSDRCTSCHLYKGDGDLEGSEKAPELGGYGSVAWTRAQIADPSSVATYRGNALDPKLKKHMPRFDKDLSAADIDIVARWTRAHARGLPSTP